MATACDLYCTMCTLHQKICIVYVSWGSRQFILRAIMCGRQACRPHKAGRSIHLCTYAVTCDADAAYTICTKQLYSKWYWRCTRLIYLIFSHCLHSLSLPLCLCAACLFLLPFFRSQEYFCTNNIWPPPREFHAIPFDTIRFDQSSSNNTKKDLQTEWNGLNGELA